MIYSLLALLSGGTVTTSILLNARLGAVKGLYKGVFVNYMTGMVVSLPIALIISGLNFPQIEVNWMLMLALSGGIIGFVCVILSSHITPKIGILYITILLFIGQLGTGVVIDIIREGSFSIGKIIGGVVIVAGLVYLLKLEKVKSK
ncbi:MAG: DMT family transporter [Clostridiales bacterium]|nr:DMT family transporter [Clostridiales bacterium]